MNIQLNKTEVENLKTILKNKEFNNIMIEQNLNSSIGVNTFIIINNERIDITDYNSW